MVVLMTVNDERTTLDGSSSVATGKQNDGGRNRVSRRSRLIIRVCDGNDVTVYPVATYAGGGTGGIAYRPQPAIRGRLRALTRHFARIKSRRMVACASYLITARSIALTFMRIAPRGITTRARRGTRVTPLRLRCALSAFSGWLDVFARRRDGISGCAVGRTVQTSGARRRQERGRDGSIDVRTIRLSGSILRIRYIAQLPALLLHSVKACERTAPHKSSQRLRMRRHVNISLIQHHVYTT
jgi:hypothetical protein